MKPWCKMIALLGIGVLCAPAFGADQARPGTLNYIEGVAQLENKPLKVKDVGSTELNPGQVLATQQGKAEILLTPGVFLRLDDHSAVKMIYPGLTMTQVELVQGRAAVEVDEIHKQNNLRIIVGGVTTELVREGYYVFNTNPATVRVFKGKAAVEVGGGKFQEVKGHHEYALGGELKGEPINFNTRKAEDEFYKWSSLRSQYLAEANNRLAEQYYGVSGFYPGWYWDPYMWNYTYIGMYPYWSPFGYGFYTPYWGSYWGGGYGRYGRGFGGGYHGGGGPHPGSAPHGGGAGGGAPRGGGGAPSGGGAGGHR
jgi:hypothetical protein